MIKTADSLQEISTYQDYSYDLIYGDPPYGLGSEVIIRPDGKPDYSKASDFMSKWDMPTGDYWEKWFKQAYRILKYGGYCVLFGMDRQLLLFKYYAALAGFSERQSLYWFFISNFPKSSDLSKMLDKQAGAEREQLPNPKIKQQTASKSTIDYGDYEATTHIEPFPVTDLAKKYNGYKYSISPLKQCQEVVMVFQKPYLTGSCLHDTLAHENGNNEVTCGALNIDGGRVPTSQKLTRPLSLNGSIPQNAVRNTSILGAGSIDDTSDILGRYPAQTFVDSAAAETLDRQNGELKSGDLTEQPRVENKIYSSAANTIGTPRFYKADQPAGCSKILHKCDFEDQEHDLYFYAPKVSKSERNAGCEAMEAMGSYGFRKDGSLDGKPLAPKKNVHPTLKPIKLNERILKLFKTPNLQKILFPFAGAGSEIIGGIKAGFTDWTGIEINQDYVDIANARITYWSNRKEQQDNQQTLF